MKLRIRGNSIRLRLTRSEIEHFGRTGSVGEVLEFGLALPLFRYELNRSGQGESIEAHFQDNCLSVSIPDGQAKGWIESDGVGLEGLQPISNNQFLRILIEKDFACLTARKGEDDSDAFVNPLVRGSIG